MSDLSQVSFDGWMKTIPDAGQLTKAGFEKFMKAIEIDMNTPIGLKDKVTKYEVKLATIHSMAVQANIHGKMINPELILAVIES